VNRPIKHTIFMKEDLKETLERIHEAYEARVQKGETISMAEIEAEFGVPKGKYKNYRANRLRTKENFVVRRVPLDRVKWWENARETFDEAELSGLAASLRDTGDPLQFPVGWMETDEAGMEWFVGFIGERRYRATCLRRDQGDPIAEMIVRVVAQPTQREALKWGLVENTQRSQLRPTEEARAILRMLDMGDEGTGEALWSKRSLAEEMGKPVSHVIWSEGALGAPARALELLDEGRTSLELVGRIGRLPAGIREAAADRLLFDLRGPVPVREARRILAEEFRRDLRRADFHREAEDLDGLPSCLGCTWYGPNRDDVEGKEAADLCLDPSCFVRKQRAQAEREREAVMSHGSRVEGAEVVILEDEVAERIFDASGALSPTCGYVDLGAKPEAYWMVDGERNLGSRPRWREALAGVMPTVLLTWDAEGHRRELVETALAVPAALSGRHGALFRAEAGADLLSAEERKALSERKNAAAKATRTVALEGAGEIYGLLARSVADWTRLMRLVEMAGGMLLKKDDFAFLCEALAPELPTGQRTERGFYEYVRSAGIGEDGLMAIVILMLEVRRLRYEGFDTWVGEGPMAEICTEAGFDAAGYAKRWKRVRGAAAKPQGDAA
jgi:hypothetical protein